jgi:hypothetical protein
MLVPLAEYAELPPSWWASVGYGVRGVELGD